ncbi:colorectal cancer associated 2 [Clupea harengus]|uniref:Colorectal cancer associated 2 n=1 Tax=Clupea harengus TaxID=7950 RepID=A0A6P8GVJ0_CLUHA|nr:colorectal cancer associated 2 [Clupea harengus]
MSDKVYQGVRVKITVKELLQRQRARQEAIKTVAKSQNLSSHEVSSHTSMPDFSSGKPLPECNLPSRSFTENIYNMPLENGYDNHQMINMMAAEHVNNSGFFPQSWSQGYSPSNLDYYGNCVVPSSPSDSFNLPSPVDCNSYSSPYSYSSSSSCYNSPTRMDLGCSFIPDNHHPYCSLQQCYCTSPLSGSQDAISQADYNTYGNADCWYTSALDNCYFKRDSLDACYL